MSEKKKDYYAILGVKPTATKAEIKAAYLNWVQLVHPDKASPTESEELKKFRNEKTADINEAWNVLKDDRKRAEYDKTRSLQSTDAQPTSPHTTPRPSDGVRPRRGEGGRRTSFEEELRRATEEHFKRRPYTEPTRPESPGWPDGNRLEEELRRAAKSDVKTPPYAEPPDPGRPQWPDTHRPPGPSDNPDKGHTRVPPQPREPFPRWHPADAAQTRKDPVREQAGWRDSLRREPAERTPVRGADRPVGGKTTPRSGQYNPARHSARSQNTPSR